VSYELVLSTSLASSYAFSISVSSILKVDLLLVKDESKFCLGATKEKQDLI